VINNKIHHNNGADFWCFGTISQQWEEKQVGVPRREFLQIIIASFLQVDALSVTTAVLSEDGKKIQYRCHGN